MKERTRMKMEEVQDLINRLFGDTSVPKEDTREAMEELHDDLEMKLASLDDV